MRASDRVSIAKNAVTPNFMLAVLKVNKGKASLLKQAFDKLHHGSWTGAADQSDEGEEAEYTPYCKLEFVC